jgi:hypothetical protein
MKIYEVQAIKDMKKKKNWRRRIVRMNDAGLVLGVQIGLQAWVFVLPLKGYNVYEWVNGRIVCGRRDWRRRSDNFFSLNLDWLESCPGIGGCELLLIATSSSFTIIRLLHTPW